MSKAFLVMLLGLVSTTNSNFLFAEDAVEIDEQGNIILKNQKPATPAPVPPTAPTPPAEVRQGEIPIGPSRPMSLPKGQAIPRQEEIIVDETKNQEAPKDFNGLSRASVRSRVAQVRAEPKENAQAVVLLRLGDRVDVLQYQGDYYKVRYLIDGDFPVEGWVLQESIQVDGSGTKPLEKSESNPYERKEPETPVVEKAEVLPSETLKDSVKLPEAPKGGDIAKSEITLPKRQKEDPSILFEETSKGVFVASPWSMEVRLGYSELSESVTTSNSANVSTKFLDYTLEGFSIEARGAYLWPKGKYNLGARGRYLFTLYDSEVSDTTGGVAKSSVLGQLHDIGLGGFANYRYDFKKISIEPEIELSLNYQVLNMNSLRDTTLNQTVLFGHSMFYMQANLVPRTFLPYDLILEPQLGITLFQSITENPTELLVAETTTQPAEYMRTGKPSTAMFLLSYGGSLVVPLKKIGLERSNLRLFGYLNDYSKKFTGNGNRAGIMTQKAKTETTILNAGLGYSYQF